jgi:Asp-tRNA(Asn)/Glu-tRNA(Gln) amidotransferase B subunit
MSRTQDPDISKGLKDGQSIEGSYEYLAVMKNDELKEHQAEQAEQAAIGIEIDNIMKLNTAVAQGTMSRDAAVMFLVSSCEYEQNEAESLISATPKAAPTTTE